METKQKIDNQKKISSQNLKDLLNIKSKDSIEADKAPPLTFRAQPEAPLSPASPSNQKEQDEADKILKKETKIKDINIGKKRFEKLKIATIKFKKLKIYAELRSNIYILIGRILKFGFKNEMVNQ